MRRNILRYPAISPKRKSTENQLISVLCGVLPNPFVIRLGLEPRTPTLKVLCSTS